MWKRSRIERLALVGVFLAAMGHIAVSAPSDFDRLLGLGCLAVTLAVAAPLTLLAQRERLVAVFVVAGTLLGWIALAAAGDAKPLIGPSRAAAETAVLFGAPLSANALAYLLVPAPLAAFALASAQQSARAVTIWAITATIAAAALAQTGARASLVGLVVGVGALTSGHYWRRPASRVAALAGAVLLTAALGFTLVTATGDRPIESRIAVWSQTAALVTVAGLGYGGFAHAQGREPSVSFRGDVPLNAHNLYLQTALDFGLLGATLLLGLVLYSLGRAAVAVARATASPPTASLVVISVVPALLATGMFESILSTSFRLSDGRLVTVVSPFLLLVAALALGTETTATESSIPSRPGRG